MTAEEKRAALAAESVAEKAARISSRIADAAFAARRLADELSRGKVTFGGILSLAALIPGPQQPFVAAGAAVANAFEFKQGGGGVMSSSGVLKGAHGLSGIVPSGFQNDSFPILVSTGERVKVETPAQAGASDNINKKILGSISALNANISQLSSRQDTIEASVNIDARGIHLMVEKQQLIERRIR